jgi:hypothetical protein
MEGERRWKARKVKKKGKNKQTTKKNKTNKQQQ